MNEYVFDILPTETAVALECEAARAKREGFDGVAERQDAVALHLRNAAHQMQKLCPDGYRLRTRVVMDFEPDVNPVYRGDFRC